MAVRAGGAQPSQDQGFRQVDGARSTAISDTTRTEGLSALDSSLLLLRAPLLTFPRQALKGSFRVRPRATPIFPAAFRPHETKSPQRRARRLQLRPTRQLPTLRSRDRKST